MSRWSSLAVLAALALSACDGGKKPGHGDGAVSREEVPAAAPQAEAAPAGATPAALYASCKDRVEKPEAAGECATDADCAPVGCGKEVCTAAKSGGDVMTTCEDRPCFQVLDHCGCQQGTCTWSLKAEAPAAAPLPASLPPTPPPTAPAPGATPPAPGATPPADAAPAEGTAPAAPKP